MNRKKKTKATKKRTTKKTTQSKSNKKTTQKKSIMKSKLSSRFVFEYSPAPESTEIVHIEKDQKLFINGEYVDAQGKDYIKSINPATEETLAHVPVATKSDVDLAVQSARNCFDNTWSKLSGKERGRYLFRIARVIQERAREFAVLESLDNGKPIKESRDVDIPLVAAHFFYHAGWADKLEYIYPGHDVRPLGVAAQVIPWNFPLLMAAWKIAPALACGNTVVIKPAETTSLSLLKLAEVFQQVGLPEGAVNIVTGEGATGAELVNHPDVNKVAFTGSTEVGKIIAQTVAGTDKKLTLELGGKSAHIIYEDAAIDQAVEGVINGIFFNQGHVCCAGSRLLVEESIHSDVIRKLKRRINQLRVGDPLDKNTDIGAINSKAELNKIKTMINDFKGETGNYWEPESTQLPSKGYFCKPCFFDDVTNSCSISRLEVFGPVLAVSTFRTPSEAIQKANDTPYGLAAGIWSEKGSKIHKTAQHLKAGVIWANTYNKFDPTSPFGGYNESGWGREGGRHGLLAYLEVNTNA